MQFDTLNFLRKWNRIFLLPVFSKWTWDREYILHKIHPLIYDNFNVKVQLTCTEKANAIPANAVGMLVRITSSPVTATTITQIKSRRIASQRLEAENRKKGRELVSNSWWNLQYTTTQITLTVKHYMYM